MVNYQFPLMLRTSSKGRKAVENASTLSKLFCSKWISLNNGELTTLGNYIICTKNWITLSTYIVKYIYKCTYIRTSWMLFSCKKQYCNKQQLSMLSNLVKWLPTKDKNCRFGKDNKPYNDDRYFNLRLRKTCLGYKILIHTVYNCTVLKLWKDSATYFCNKIFSLL